MALTRLFDKELAEARRMWRRLTQQKRVLAINIEVRKAATLLHQTKKVDEVMSVLESCLLSDFSGLELQVSGRLCEQHDSGDSHSQLTTWFRGERGNFVISLQLGVKREGEIGSLLLYRNAPSGWLVDTELLKGELCTALSKALQNCTSDRASGVAFRVRQNANASYAHGEAFGG